MWKEGPEAGVPVLSLEQQQNQVEMVGREVGGVGEDGEGPE